MTCFGQWRLDACLSHGSFGNVFSAHRDGQPIIVKVLFFNDRASLLEGLAEIVAYRYLHKWEADLSYITHSTRGHVTSILAAESPLWATVQAQPTQLAFGIELEREVVLTDQLLAISLSRPRIVAIGSSLLKAVKRLRQLGLVHLDVKAENVACVMHARDAEWSVRLFDLSLMEPVTRIAVDRYTDLWHESLNQVLDYVTNEFEGESTLGTDVPRGTPPSLDWFASQTSNYYCHVPLARMNRRRVADSVHRNEVYSVGIIVLECIHGTRLDEDDADAFIAHLPTRVAEAEAKRPGVKSMLTRWLALEGSVLTPRQVAQLWKTWTGPAST